ncbi:MAG: hypothetical protein ABSB19_15170 [Methylomonas sp.]|jgi:MSHA biogenesis protein MshJ
MSANVELYWQKFISLSQRERIMVVTACLVLLWGSWNKLFFQDLQNRNEALAAEIDTLQNQVDSGLKVVKQFEGVNLNNPDIGVRQQLDNLRNKLANLKQGFNQGEKKFVSSESMARALSDILKQNGQLKLIKLETLPVTPFGNNDKQTEWLFRHTLAITIQGDYFSTLNYLKTLESLPWRIQWDSIDYQVKNYPVAETRIQVYTLSFEKDWLGV